MFFFFLSQRHSFSEDTWVKFSNLSEEKIIGTYDTTAHVSKFLQFFSLRVKAHPYYQGSLLLVPQSERGTRTREPWEQGWLRSVGRNGTLRGTLPWKGQMFRESDLDCYRNVYHGFRIRMIKQPMRRVANINTYFSLRGKC